MYVFLDIETVPSQTEGALEAIRQTIRPPAQYSKPESIQRWLDENADAEAEKQWRRTALDGAQGEVISVAFAVDDDEPLVYARHHEGTKSEADLLREVYAVLTMEMQASNATPDSVTWCGHNAAGFDLPFLYKRSVVLGVRPSVNLRHDCPPWHPNIQDTMALWAGRTGTVSLDALCRALSVPSPKAEGMDGSRVYDRWKAGDTDAITRYNVQDVEAARACYKRLAFVDKLACRRRDRASTADEDWLEAVNASAASLADLDDLPSIDLDADQLGLP